MNSERNALKAGLFIVISIGLIIGVVIAIKGVSRFLEPTTRHQVRFDLKDDIGGLAEGDEVRIGGAKVGTVRDVDLQLEGEHPGIVITFAIPRKYTLHKDANVGIQTTVTGVSVLNLQSLGAANTPPLATGDVIPGTAGASFAQIADQVRGVIGDVRTVTLPKMNVALDKAGDAITVYKGTGEDATALIQQLRGKIDPIIERYNAFADKGTGALGDIGSLFSDVKTDFRTTIANLSKATTSINEKLPGILEKADGSMAKISRSLDEINNALVDIKEVASNTRDATASARTILATNHSKIDGMVMSLKTTADNLKAASAEIRHSPWRLLYKPSPGELENMTLYDSARQFADGAGSMQDAAEALRDALKDPKSSDTQIKALVEKLDSSFDNFKTVENDLWKKVKE